MPKSIKKILKYIYKVFVNTLFKSLYGKVTINNSSEIKVKSLSKPNIKNKENKKYKIFIIRNGRICTDGVEQVAYISGNNLVKDISFTQIKGKLVSAKKNFVIYRGTPYLKKKYQGTVVSLAQGASGDNNYFHWMFDILPKIKIILSNYKINNIDYFYMPEIQPFQKKILSIFGFKKFNIINSKKNKHIQADKIIIPEHPWYVKNTIDEEVNNLPIWISKWLRKICLKNKKNNIKVEKVFIDRSESEYKRCQLINNDQIKKYLLKKGFKSIKVGKLDFLDQIALFNNAKFIIGPHGAAFTNLIFCKKNTKVIEIKPTNRPNNFKEISKAYNLMYKQIITPPIKKNRKNGDIYLKPNQLSKLI